MDNRKYAQRELNKFNDKFNLKYAQRGINANALNTRTDTQQFYVGIVLLNIFLAAIAFTS